MSSDKFKARRLVDAQSTIENLARSNVAKCVARLADYENKVELAKRAVSASDATRVFTDIHIRHIQRLVEQCGDASRKLSAARADLEREMVRTDKLRNRLKMAEVAADREMESKAVFERLDWSLLQR